MKLEAEWLHHAGTVALCTALEQAGYQALFVGGCVRNGLIGADVQDIDIATDARPEKVIELSQAANLRPIPTGIEHGTITVIAQSRPLEVTTFRRDIETDGRRAVVAFADGIEEDAKRRDFTMNALYAGRDGEVLDPTGQGLDDLQARRLRFIGLPEDRIREDYLRILRFFRFHAWYADPQGGFDADGLAACAALSSGIETLSCERVGSEIKKLLAASDPSMAVAAMEQTGVLAQTLAGASARLLPILIHLEADTPTDPIRRLAAIASAEQASALRLSRAEAKHLAILRKGMESETGAGELGYRHGFDFARDIILLRAALFEAEVDQAAIEAARKGAAAQFPVRAADLDAQFDGPALGAELARLEGLWIGSGFKLSKAELLA